MAGAGVDSLAVPRGLQAARKRQSMPGKLQRNLPGWTGRPLLSLFLYCMFVLDVLRWSVQSENCGGAWLPVPQTGFPRGAVPRYIGIPAPQAGCLHVRSKNLTEL